MKDGLVTKQTTTTDDRPLTVEACRQYLEDSIFRLRPPSYAKSFPKWPGAIGLEIEMWPFFTHQDQRRVDQVVGDSKGSSANSPVDRHANFNNQEQGKAPRREPISTEPSAGPKDYSSAGTKALLIDSLPNTSSRSEGAGNNQTPVPVPIYQTGLGTSHVLLRLAAQEGWSVERHAGNASHKDQEGHKNFSDQASASSLARLLLDDYDNISFEPGGQVEFSSKPYPCLVDALRRTRRVQRLMDEALQSNGMRFLQMGINPWQTPDEIGLQMAKSRYQAMNTYYNSIGTYGRRMMRQTSTVQVNLDFGPTDEILVLRYMAAQLMAPMATATFAYSPIVDGQDSGCKSFRSRIWRHTDPSHTGLPGHAAFGPRVTRSECLEHYLAFALEANVIFVETSQYEVPTPHMTFKEWIENSFRGVKPQLADFKTHLSLLFPEVRPRGFLELRSIDCQARVWQRVPACYYLGLLYDEDTLRRLVDLLLPYKDRMLEFLSVAEGGLVHDELAGLAKEVMAMAVVGFEALPSCFKEEGSDLALKTFSARFTEQRRTPADDLLDQFRSTQALTLGTFKRLEDYWIDWLL